MRHRELAVHVGPGHRLEPRPAEALEPEARLLRDPHGQEQRGPGEAPEAPLPGLGGTGEAHGQERRGNAPAMRWPRREGPRQEPAGVALDPLEGAEPAQENQGPGHHGMIVPGALATNGPGPGT